MVTKDLILSFYISVYNSSDLYLSVSVGKLERWYDVWMDDQYDEQCYH